VDIELSDQESAALQQALKSYLSDLRMEIVDTDNAEYKHGLRSERELLAGVVTKLDEATKASSEPDAAGRVVVRLAWVWSD
jgi:hypothetical protein